VPPDAALRRVIEVHKVMVARQVLRDCSPSDDLWPSQHIPKRLAAARAKYAEYLEHEAGNM
jgi:acyl-CoA dehydrogenase